MWILAIINKQTTTHIRERERERVAPCCHPQFSHFYNAKKMTNKFISAKENDKDNVNLMGVQGLRGMSHKYKSLTTTILRRALTIKCMKEYLQRYFLCFEKAYFCLEKFLLRSCKNIFQYIYIYIKEKPPFYF